MRGCEPNFCELPVVCPELCQMLRHDVVVLLLCDICLAGRRVLQTRVIQVGIRGKTVVQAQFHAHASAALCKLCDEVAAWRDPVVVCEIASLDFAGPYEKAALMLDHP